MKSSKKPIPAHFVEIRSAIKRAQTMGKPHKRNKKFETHPIAACVDNYVTCIENETDGDHLSVCFWLLHIARAINRFCNENRVDSDEAAQFWLHRFSQCVAINSPIDFARL